MSDESQRILAAMRARGFTPTGQSRGDRVEFVKTYALEDGRRCRVCAFVAKPTPLDPFPTLLGAHVSVSRYFHAHEVVETPTAVPETARGDLLALVEEVTEEMPPRSVLTRPCGLCGVELTEYRLNEEDVVTCLDPKNCPHS